MENTTYTDILSSFQSLPHSQYALPNGLDKQCFLDALGEYELELDDLNYDEITEKFPVKLKQYQIKTISLIMYTYYLTRELSRAEKLSGINGKDISMTGGDESKRVTKADLELQMAKAKKMIDKQMQRCYS